tara:strand:+ start:33 stop:605 length:573 start_codon:yes stop_codon:yes gene_type:complete
MADSKISALPASTTPLAGTEVLPIVQSSATKQVSVANLTAGRAISATQLTLTTGNLIVASGQGIDFSATSSGSGTMTSELLSDYEEGTWIPNQGSGLTVVGAFTSSGTYTKVGRQVTVTGNVAGATSIAGASGGVICTSLPFTVSGAHAGSVGIGNVNQGSTLIAFSTNIYLATALTANAGITFTVTYIV